MKLAEALLLRADRQRTLAQLRARAPAVGRYQGGEEPAEDANALLLAASDVLTELAGSYSSHQTGRTRSTV